MAENIDLQLNLDSGPFVQGAQAAATASEQMASAYAGSARQAGLLRQAMNVATPTRMMMAGFGGATAAAAAWEQSLGSLQATARVTGQSMTGLRGAVAGLAREFPVGNRGALEIVSSMQQMGITGKNQIGTIRDLGKAFTQLGAATGQNASVIGRQMVSLNRAFGANDNNVQRFRDMSDSLTTATAKIGGSSSDILAFSKAIAPMARSAGIGQSAVMGMSASFARMGEDGFTAANAMNKMLSDLNRSVRDGSGEMGTYANIVGKTRGEFEQLFKMDPTKAVSQLMTSLAGPGGQTERNLERIGLDGQRTRRAIQGAIQSGGLEQAVATSVGGYGSGITGKAGKSAMDGLQDEFTKLASAAEQVTEAMGRPLLGALTNIVEVAGAPLRGTARLSQAIAGVGDRRMGLPGINTGREGLSISSLVPAVVIAVTAYMGLRALGALGLGAATGRQLFANNGLIRGFREGLSEGGNRSATPGLISQARAAGTMPTTMYGRVVGGARDFGAGVGMGRARIQAEMANARYDRLVAQGMSSADAARAVTTPGPSVGQRIRGAVMATPRALAAGARGLQMGYNNLLASSARAIAEPNYLLRSGLDRLTPGRNATGAPTGSMGRLVDQMRAANVSSDSLATRVARMGTVLSTNAQQAMGAANVLQRGGQMVQTSLATTARGLIAFGSSVAAVGRATGVTGAIRGAGATLLNPMALATMAGTAVFMNSMNSGRKAREEAENFGSASISGTVDKYRESMGLAAESAGTFAEQVSAASKAIMRSVTDVDQAAKVDDQDVAFAKENSRVQREYVGDNASIANQVRSIAPGGLDAQTLQGVKIDLLRQRDRSQVEDILSRVTAGGDVDYAKMFGGELGDQVGASAMTRFRRGFLGQQGGTSTTGGGTAGAFGTVAGLGIGQTITQGLDFFGVGGAGDASRVGGVGKNRSEVTKAQADAIRGITESIGTAFRENTSTYSPAFAEQERARAAEMVFKQVSAATNNPDVIARMSEELSQSLGGGDKKRRVAVSEEMASDAGGFIAALMKQDPSARRMLKGIDLDASDGGGVAATRNANSTTQVTSNIALFGDALSNQADKIDGSLNKMTAAFLKTPGDTQKMRDAINGFVQEGETAGMNMQQVGARALETVKALGDATSDISKLALAVFRRTQAETERNAGFQGSAETTRQRLVNAGSLLQSADATPEGQGRYEEAENAIYGEREAVRQRMVARLQQERQFNIQRDRMNEDFKKQREYSDYDYRLGVERTEDDFYTNRRRAQRDFNLQIEYGQKDYEKARIRANRDFTKQLRRQNEDAAKAMYDPYKRIQAQAVYDIGTLMQNLAEQNQAMQEQAKGLNELRRAGVNNNVIDMLGLNKADNAQQLQRVLGDIAADPNVANQLNATIGARVNLGGALNSDASNKELGRAKEDFAQTLKDQETDYNESIRRSREAFDKSLADSLKDLQKNLARSEKDYQEAMRRQQEAMDKSMTRMRQDIEESQKEILGSFEELADATMKAINGETVDFNSLMTDTLATTVSNTRDQVATLLGELNRVRAAADATAVAVASVSSAEAPGGTVGSAAVNAGPVNLGNQAGSGRAPKVGAQAGLANYSMGAIGRGNTTGLIDDIVGDAGVSRVSVTSVKRNRGDKSLHEKWQAVDYGGPREDLVKLAKYLMALAESGKIEAQNIIYYDPKTNQKYGWLGGKGRHNYSSKTWADHRDHVHIGMKPDQAKQTVANAFAGQDSTPSPDPHRKAGFARGGIVTSRVDAVIGEAGSHEAVIPLNDQGVSKLAEAMTAFISDAQARMMITGQHGTQITYTGNTFVEDHSTRVTGPITVQAQDPNAMMNALQAKARQANLTATPTRRSA